MVLSADLLCDVVDPPPPLPLSGMPAERRTGATETRMARSLASCFSRSARKPGATVDTDTLLVGLTTALGRVASGWSCLVART
ncbi:MAG: hypothetical protein ACOC8H_00160 [bacterium]